MYTGIVQTLGKVIRMELQPSSCLLEVQIDQAYAQNLTLGCSIAIQGVCLTAIAFTPSSNQQGCLVQFNLTHETLAVTNLGQLHEGDIVNVERSLTFGDEIGGHLVAGHVNCCITIAEIVIAPNQHTLYFNIPEAIKDYLFPKGFVALNGASLTLGDFSRGRFCVHLIPETLRQTTFSFAQVGDFVNLEIDPQTRAIVDTARAFLIAHHI